MSSNEIKLTATLTKLFDSLAVDEKKDITFTFENSNVKIKANKLILQAVSSTFASMFSGSFKETDTALIKDIRPEIFQILIDGIYMKPIKIPAVEDAAELYNAAEMYDVEDLKAFSRQVMKRSCSVYNCLYLYEKAVLFGLDDIKSRCIELFQNDHKTYTIFTLLTKHERINEDALAEYISRTLIPHARVYQTLEVLVELKILQTYKKAVANIRFLEFTTRQVLLAKLLTDSEKLAIISNIDAVKGGYEPGLKMPENFSTRCVNSS